jgi:hypothetical protein
MYCQFFLLGNEMFLARDKVPTDEQTVVIADEVVFTLNQYYYSSPLSDNQWQLEAEQIQNVALGMMQQLVLDYAAPPDYIVRPGIQSDSYIIPPDTDVGRKLCAQQKYRSSSHLSFNLFGIIFVLVMGSIIITISYSISPLVAASQLRSGSEKALYRRQEWQQDDVLHLLRAAFRGQDVGSWPEDSDAIVPVTIEFANKMKWKASKEDIADDD